MEKLLTESSLRGSREEISGMKDGLMMIIAYLIGFTFINAVPIYLYMTNRGDFDRAFSVKLLVICIVALIVVQVIGILAMMNPVVQALKKGVRIGIVAWMVAAGVTGIMSFTLLQITR